MEIQNPLPLGWMRTGPGPRKLIRQNLKYEIKRLRLVRLLGDLFGFRVVCGKLGQIEAAFAISGGVVRILEHSNAASHPGMEFAPHGNEFRLIEVQDDG